MKANSGESPNLRAGDKELWCFFVIILNKLLKIKLLVYQNIMMAL